MGVCVCGRIFTCVCVYACIYVCMCLCMCLCVCLCVCVCIYMRFVFVDECVYIVMTVRVIVWGGGLTN